MKPSKLKSERSKLETHLDILKALATTAPLRLTQIEDQVKVNSKSLREKLDFLIKQGLVEERTMKKMHVVYAITQRGTTVLKYFRELTQALPIVEEARSQTNRALLLY